MKKLTRLQRSQNAHLNLRRKHADTPGVRGEVLFTYHNKIFQVQRAQKRILSRSERKMEFDSIKSFFNRKPTTYAQVSDEFFKYGKYK